VGWEQKAGSSGGERNRDKTSSREGWQGKNKRVFIQSVGNVDGLTTGNCPIYYSGSLELRAEKARRILTGQISNIEETKKD